MAESTHVTRRVSRDPAGAAVAARRWHRSLTAVTGTRHVSCGHGLWLRREGRTNGPDPLELYAVRGVLWVVGRPVAVTFEVSMWSSHEVQVGIRPTRLWWPVRTPGFATRGSRALEEFASVLSGLAVLRPGPGLAAPSAASQRDLVPSAA